MTIGVGALISVLVAVITIATFFIARLKDAEERGALKQRVHDLERRVDTADQKINKVLEKLDEIKDALGGLVAEHNHIIKKNGCSARGKNEN